MVKITCYDEKLKSIFEKYITEVGLNTDIEFYRSVDNVKRDVEFFQEFMSRTNKRSGFSFEPRLTMQGLIHNGFVQKINRYFNYYDYEILAQHLYVFEILKRLYANNWIDGKGVNVECVKKVIEFHPVVTYYLDVKEISDYTYDFIGSSYGIREFDKVVQDELNAVSA